MIPDQIGEGPEIFVVCARISTGGYAFKAV